MTCKKKCLIGLVGLSRTFVETAPALYSNIIDHNSASFDFTLVVNTEEHNNNSKRIRSKVVAENLSEKLHAAYKNLHNIIYFDISPDARVAGKSAWMARISAILEQEKDNLFDIYVFIRLDCALNKPLDLNRFCKGDGEFFSIISGKIRDVGRADHKYDYDYCWIGSKNIFEKICQLKHFTNFVKSLDLDTLLMLRSRINFCGTYCDECFKSGTVLEKYPFGMWVLFNNITNNDSTISVLTKDDDDIYADLVR
jgi:hypothetical protein